MLKNALLVQECQSSKSLIADIRMRFRFMLVEATPHCEIGTTASTPSTTLRRSKRLRSMLPISTKRSVNLPPVHFLVVSLRTNSALGPIEPARRHTSSYRVRIKRKNRLRFAAKTETTPSPKGISIRTMALKQLPHPRGRYRKPIRSDWPRG